MRLFLFVVPPGRVAEHLEPCSEQGGVLSLALLLPASRIPAETSQSGRMRGGLQTTSDSISDSFNLLWVLTHSHHEPRRNNLKYKYFKFVFCDLCRRISWRQFRVAKPVPIPRQLRKVLLCRKHLSSLITSYPQRRSLSRTRKGRQSNQQRRRIHRRRR